MAIKQSSEIFSSALANSETILTVTLTMPTIALIVTIGCSFASTRLCSIVHVPILDYNFNVFLKGDANDHSKLE